MAISGLSRYRDRVVDITATPLAALVGQYATLLAERKSGNGAEQSGNLNQLASRPDVSVVIPIYNSANALARCLDSLVAAGDPAEVLLVDDYSYEPAIASVCAAFAERWPDTLRLRNERNLGFVSTVNRGMRNASSANDIVLLNSDTEVSAGWLRRLSVAAYGAKNTATVCPLSNAAGVFSIPRAFVDDDLPSGFTVSMCQRALTLSSARVLEEVPTTSAFCILIKREVIDQIGFFDDGLFQRGYGEENDFNERAAAAGFRHRVDDATFVFHARGLSFGASKALLKKRNAPILNALHPGHRDRQRGWELSSELDRTRNAYSRLVDWSVTATEAERMFVLGDAPITIDVGVDVAAGNWTEQKRSISVSVVDDRAAIDLFGCRQIHIRKADLEKLLFDLGWRWDASLLTTNHPNFLETIRTVGRALGASSRLVA